MRKRLLRQTRSLSQNRIWGGAEPLKSGPFGPKKSLFEPHPLNPPTKTPISWPTLWLKVDLLPDRVRHTPALGYGPVLRYNKRIFSQSPAKVQLKSQSI